MTSSLGFPQMCWALPLFQKPTFSSEQEAFAPPFWRHLNTRSLFHYAYIHYEYFSFQPSYGSRHRSYTTVRRDVKAVSLFAPIDRKKTAPECFSVWSGFRVIVFDTDAKSASLGYSWKHGNGPLRIRFCEPCPWVIIAVVALWCRNLSFATRSVLWSSSPSAPEHAALCG